MENETNSNDRRNDIVFSKKLRAGKRRTYFFDVKTTRTNDYFITITESKKRIDGEGYDRHKVFLYKEDLNRFMESLSETVNHIKTDLMPEYDFDEFAKKQEEYERQRSAMNENPMNENPISENPVKENPADTSKNDIPSEKKSEHTENEDDLKW